MTVQFDKQINIHQAKKTDQTTEYSAHMQPQKSDLVTALEYITPKICHSFHGKLTLSEPGTYFCYLCCLP